MAEYIVEFDKTPYDQMVADGILKETDNPTLYGMPVRGEIIRCRDCGYIIETLAYPEDYEDVEPIWYCGKFGHGCSPNGFCAWAERDE